jgi:hypothetical protein
MVVSTVFPCAFLMGIERRSEIHLALEIHSAAGHLAHFDTLGPPIPGSLGGRLHLAEQKERVFVGLGLGEAAEQNHNPGCQANDVQIPATFANTHRRRESSLPGAA